ncbi:MAG: hypothetical protein ABSF84_05965 [Acidimicrobiales bacterium]
MIRKLVLMATVVALPFAALAAIGSGDAVASAPVTFTGSIQCDALGGLSIASSAGAGATNVDAVGTTYTVTFTGKFKKCVGVGSTSLIQGGEHLKSGVLTYSYTYTNSTVGGLCAALGTFGPLPAMTAHVTWVGSPALPGFAPSTITFGGGFAGAGYVFYAPGSTVGSFAGPSSSLILTDSSATVLSDCATSSGLTSLAMGGFAYNLVVS